MKKIFLILSLSLFLTSCKENIPASIINPFQKQEPKQATVTLANGMNVNLEENIEELLKAEPIKIDDYIFQAKVVVRNTANNTMQILDFPKIENLPNNNNKLDLVYEDKENNLVWEKDATQSGLMTYNESLEYCKTFGLKTYGKPFNIPSPEQLKTILSEADSQLDPNIFKNINGTYWTTHKFAYNFYWADGELVDKDTGLAYVRCVNFYDENNLFK